MGYFFEWKVVLRNLMMFGFSIGDIATRTGIPRPVLYKIMQDEDDGPNISSWLELINLHYEYCPQQHVKLSDEIRTFFAEPGEEFSSGQGADVQG